MDHPDRQRDQDRLWQRVREGQVTAVFGRLPDAPEDLRLLRVSCEVAPAALRPLLEARRLTEAILGEARTKPQERAKGGRWRTLFGDTPERTTEAVVVEQWNNLAKLPGARWAVVFDAVERADPSTLAMLTQIVKRPGWMRLPMVLVFHGEPKDAGAELLAAVQARGEDAVIRGEETKAGPEPTVKWTSLPPKVLRVLRAGALVGPGFEAKIVAELLSLEPLAVLERLQQALDLGVPVEDRGEGRFSLPTAALSALSTSLMPSLAQAWHRRLGKLLGARAGEEAAAGAKPARPPVPRGKPRAPIAVPGDALAAEIIDLSEEVVDIAEEIGEAAAALAVAAEAVGEVEAAGREDMLEESAVAEPEDLSQWTGSAEREDMSEGAAAGGAGVESEDMSEGTAAAEAGVAAVGGAGAGEREAGGAAGGAGEREAGGVAGGAGEREAGGAAAGGAGEREGMSEGAAGGGAAEREAGESAAVEDEQKGMTYGPGVSRPAGVTAAETDAPRPAQARPLARRKTVIAPAGEAQARPLARRKTVMVVPPPAQPEPTPEPAPEPSSWGVPSRAVPSRLDDPLVDEARAAEHLRLAGDFDAAAQHLCEAARKAADMGAPQAAVQHADGALALLATLPASATRRQLRAATQITIGRVQWQSAGYDQGFTLGQALATLEAARAELDAEAPADLVVELAQSLAGVCFDLGDARSLERALAELETASRVMREGGDDLGAACLLNDQAGVLVRMGNPGRALGLLRASRQVFDARAGEDPVALRELAETEHLFARLPLHAQLRPGREQEGYEMGLAHAQAAERAYHELGEARELGRVWETIGRLELRRGGLEPAKQRLESALEVLTQLGDLTGLAQTTEALAELRAAAGDDAAAVTLLRDSVVFNRDKGSPLGLMSNRRVFTALAERLAGQPQHADGLQEVSILLRAGERELGIAQ